MKEKIERIQKVLRKHEIDNWIVFCHHSYDIHLKYLLEKWHSSSTLVNVPQEGTPKVIASVMEAMMVDDEIYEVQSYKKGDELMELLESEMKGFSKDSKIALNFVGKEEALRNQSYDIITSGTFKALTGFNQNLTYVSAKDLIFDIRAVKTKKEIENHKISSKLAEELMVEVVEPQIKPGMMEKELAAIIEFECNKRGGVAFEAIVGSGPNAAIPHHKSGGGKIEQNQVLLIDYGSTHNWANSDITHTYWIGAKPPEGVLRAYEAVDKAKEAAYTKIKAGVLGEEVELAVRGIFEEFGYDHEKLYMHSTGHPIGIETHDIGHGIYRGTPTRPSKPLLENSVITVEPGLYFAGEFGVRLEDDCVVTKEGSIRLSNTPKEIVCL
ncbi:MAG: aminopeptidase P family protein [Candidatus Heimdallarchaeota archaeon]|nr:aminopeptidase P family protein [Candidatus Heimdallarchaeota archaeon]MCK4770153.1 aminopeptidase P family protein [Candidatus Heimdallarchaeota archaeon]